MSKTIEISRELAERLARNLASGSEAYKAQGDLCKILAAPVVERQADPVLKSLALRLTEAQMTICDLKASPPAPVAVALPTREDFELWRESRNAAIAGEGGSSSWYVTQAHYATWEACLDKIKELNQ